MPTGLISVVVLLEGLLVDAGTLSSCCTGSVLKSWRCLYCLLPDQCCLNWLACSFWLLQLLGYAAAAVWPREHPERMQQGHLRCLQSPRDLCLSELHISSGLTIHSRSVCQQYFFGCTPSIILVSVSNVHQEAAMYTMRQMTGTVRYSPRIGYATTEKGNST